MKGAALVALLSFLSAPQEGGELEEVLSTLERRVEGIRDFRASFVYTYGTTDGRTKERKDKSPFLGSLAWRAPGRAAWSVRVVDSSYAHQSYAEWVDQGWRGAIDDAEVRLHIPWRIHAPEDFGGLDAREHHGATYYRALINGHSPPPVPLLSAPPTFHPILFLYQLAPRAVLGRLPSIKVAFRKEEEGRKFIVLTSKPVDDRDAARVDESQRRRDATWFGSEIWVDEAEGAIDRVVASTENSGAAPRHRYTTVFRFSRRVGGLATLIVSDGSHMEFRDLRSNVGVKDEETRIDLPENAIVRDWVAQPKEVYDQRLQKDPADVAAWLSLGTLRFRQQNYAAAVDAFKKVVELRPKAPEGYIALAYFLKERSVADSVEQFLDAAVQKGVNFPVLRLAMAHRRYKDHGGRNALPHFEAVLRETGEDPSLLETMIYMVGWTGPDLRKHYFRLFRGEIAKDEPTFGYTRWESPRPPPPDLQELAKLYEDAIAANGGSVWMRKRLLDLYIWLQRPKDARRHADAVVAIVEREDLPHYFGASERAMEFYTAEKDWAGATRLQKAFASKPGERAKRTAALYEIEIAGARATLDDLKKLVDERIRPEWNPREKLSFSPSYVLLIKVLAREKRSTEFLKKIVEAIGAHENRQLYIDIVEDAVREFRVPHADGQALLVRLKEKTTGVSAGATELVNLCRQYGWAKQWNAAADKAREALAHKEITDPQRATAEGVLAECHLAATAFDPAIAACDRALGLKDLRPLIRSGLHELRGRAFLGARRAREAAEAFGRAFAELAGEKHLETRWRAVKDLRRQLPILPRPAVEEAAAARPDEMGLRLLLVLAWEREGQFAKAAAALAEVLQVWPGDGFLLRELAILWARADEPHKALAARTAFVAAREKQREALSGVQSEDLLAVDYPLITALEERGDAALMKDFAVKLAADPDPGRHTSTLARLLTVIHEDEFIDKIHAALMRAATREDQKLNFRYAAAQAWHDMGRTEKAVTLYKDAAAGKGFSPPFARAARETIERWEAEAKERVELLRWIRARMEKLPPGRRESEELHAIIRELSTSRNLPMLDHLWRTGLREKKPDALFLKLAALRAREPQAKSALERLAARPDVSPEWRLAQARMFLRNGDVARAVELFREELPRIPLPAQDREAFVRKAADFVWDLPEKDRAELGASLAAKNAFPWAWELRESFLKVPAERLEFAGRWQKAAAAGEDRACAGRAIAQTLLALRRPKDALDALTEALREKNLGADLQADLESLRMGPLIRFGPTAEAAPVLLRHLQDSSSLPYEAWRWADAVAAEGKGDEWLKLWNEAKPASAAAMFFGAFLEVHLGREEAALARLQEGSTKFADNGWLHRQLGDVYVRARKFDLAADAYEKAIIHWKPEYPDLKLSLQQDLARAMGKAGKLKQAAEFIRGVAKTSDRAGFARIAEDLKLFDLAAQLYREALEARKDDVLTRFSLARVLRAAGRPEDAEAEYRELMKADHGKRLGALSGLLSTLVERKDSAGFSRALLDEAVRAKGGRQEMWGILNVLPPLPDDLKESALAEWKQRVAEAADVEAVHILSAMLARRWNPEGLLAGEDLRAALQRFPGSASLRLEAAEQLRASRRPLEAAEEFERAAALDPEGKLTGHPRASLLGQAVNALIHADEPERAFVLALSLTGEAFPRRTFLALEDCDFDFWGELSRRRDRLPVPREPAAAEHIRILLTQLGDDDIERREAASKDLRAAGLPALGPLAGLVESPDIERRVRARAAIRAILRD